ncbi:hypothetical protein ATO13_08521 [Stappia sp. 22II-S9-Z10]|nr:hypothetical protein ATO13_08521 [Stappia sp. 22II-S9-Z10]
MHIRQRIREAVETRLEGLVGYRVFKHPFALFPGSYPAFRVTAMGEAAEPNGFEILAREIDLQVDGWTVGDDELEDRLDAMSEAVEAAIASDGTFGGLATDTTLQRTEKVIDGDGDRRVGRLRLTFLARAVTTRADPSTPL